MTDQEAQKAFDEVYNKFWLNYRGKIIPRESDEWERMNVWAAAFTKKYPFMEQLAAEMVSELGQRMWRREDGR